MNSTYKDSSQKANRKIQWSRDDISRKIIDFACRKNEISQRKFAQENRIPRTTFQSWLNRIDRINADPELIAFFESPAGVQFLHLLIYALHFEFTKVGCASIHNICNFLELSGLSQFIAASYGAHQKISDKMDSILIKFGQMEQERLSKDMLIKMITLCEDETFNPWICLVGIEPVSNFILVEEYASDRSGKTWNEAVANSLSNLPVRVLQGTSDEAKGLIHHVTKGLMGHHSPDVFHVLYEISKGTSGALASVVRSTEKEHEKCVEETRNALESREKYENLEKRPIGRRPDFEKRIEKARENDQKVKDRLDQARHKQETVKNAKVEISRVYHPYNPITGEKQDPHVVSKLLDCCFDRIRQASESLSDRCKKRIDKAYRVTDKMTATIAFFFLTIASFVEELNISSEKQDLIHTRLIPGYYLQKVAEKEKDLERREIIRQKSKELLSILDDSNGPFSDCSNKELERIIKTAKECSGIFQRSSSCVEGRNAQLSLRHHGMHRLSNRKLKALTVIHNYYLKRPDGTTAAERFFERKPIGMFDWLLDNMPLPARPRSKRKIAA